jgi:FkbM family methyltransferase
LHTKSEPIASQAQGAQPNAAAADRAFGLAGPSPDPELETLLALSQWIDETPQAVFLSSLTGPMIRQAFPANQPRSHILNCRSGLKLEVDASDIFAASLAFGSLQEADDFAAFMTLVEPGATVVDVGANFGLYAAHAGLHAGAGGQVFAFEPAPQVFELLAGNIRRNGLDRVCHAARAAVAEQNRTATFRVATDVSFSGLRNTGRSSTAGMIEVEVIALDDFAPLARRPVDLMKIDVEGGEAAVLRGARHLLARSPDVMVMFEYSHKNLDAEAHAALLEELRACSEMGLEVHGRSSAGALEPIALDALQGKRSENLFMFRRRSPHGARLEALKPARPRPNRKDRAMLRMVEGSAQICSRYDSLIRDIQAAARAKAGPEAPQDPVEAFRALRRAWEG